MAGIEVDLIEGKLRQEYDEVERQVQNADMEYETLLKAKISQICRLLYAKTQKQQLLKTKEAIQEVTQRLLVLEMDERPSNVSIETLHEDTFSLLHTQETVLADLKTAYAKRQQEEEAKIERALEEINRREASLTAENARLKTEISVRKQHLATEQEKNRSLKATNLALNAQFPSEEVKRLYRKSTNIPQPESRTSMCR